MVLPPDVSRRLIGRAVAQLPQLKRAMANGRIIIAGSGTTRHVVKALLGEDPGHASFTIGWIRDGQLCETPVQGRGPGPYLIDHSHVSRGWPGPLLEQFEAGDIYIKSGNAIDAAGNVGILLGSPVGGSIGSALPIICARGAELIIPISLQKMVPSVAAAGGRMGQQRITRATGARLGYMPVMAGFATVVTEIEALRALYHLEATMVAAGGTGECEGAVTMHVEGGADGIGRLLDDIGRDEGSA
ncbi:MAG TPA: hypothetical protein ENK35_06265 [Candidatus Tenderia sp.]|nr:hypothetical protein [Candidatus Tenderia sp.]